jgi:hypothetical protein
MFANLSLSVSFVSSLVLFSLFGPINHFSIFSVAISNSREVEKGQVFSPSPSSLFFPSEAHQCHLLSSTFVWTHIGVVHVPT